MKYFPFKISFFLAIILVGIAYMGNAQHVHADGCTVSNAKFRTNAGNDPDNFYNDLNRPYIYVDVYTSGCQGSTRSCRSTSSPRQHCSPRCRAYPT